MYDLVCLAEGPSAPSTCGLPPSRAPDRVPPGLWAEPWTVEPLVGGQSWDVPAVLHGAAGGQGGGAPSSGPLVLSSWGRAHSSSVGGLTLGPEDGAEPPPGPRTSSQAALGQAVEPVPGTQPGTSFQPQPQLPCENVFTGVYFLLEMSLLGMNTDWFVLKLTNC